MKKLFFIGATVLFVGGAFAFNVNNSVNTKGSAICGSTECTTESCPLCTSTCCEMPGCCK